MLGTDIFGAVDGMSARELKAHILPGLLAGARNGLALDRTGVARPLQALSLTGQALRFDRPAPPASFDIDTAVADTRALVPDSVRRQIVRLLSAKIQGVAANLFAAALARALAANKLRLHPFDLPRLDGFVRAHAEQLGAEALAFAQRDATPDQKQGYFDADAVDDGNWMLATPAIKAGYIAGRRRTDSVAALALVEAAWPNENADNRVRLLSALREGLGPDDVAFLKGLEKDRAPRVRELAQRLLGRLPGHEGDNPALRNVLDRIQKGQAGLLRKRPILKLELPATVNAALAAHWVGEAFDQISLDELASALGMTVADLAPAAEKDDNLLLGFALMAARDGRLDVLATIVDSYLPDAFKYLLGKSDLLDSLSVDDRVRFADIVIRPRDWPTPMPYAELLPLPALMQRPVSDALMRDMLRAPAWLDTLKSLGAEAGNMPAAAVDRTYVVAVLCPLALRSGLRTQLAPLGAVTAHTLLFLDIMDALETAHA